MINTIKAERLKMKRTIIKKLIWVLPMMLLLLTCISPRYFQQNAMNWWYVQMLPFCVGMVSIGVMNKDKKKLNYSIIRSCPVQGKDIWWSKAAVSGYYISISCLVISLAVVIGGLFLPEEVVMMSMLRNSFGGLFVILASLWLIPLSMLLNHYIGLFMTLMFNEFMSIIGVIMASRALWWINPYSWVSRAMVPIIRIMPNGLIAEEGNPMTKEWTPLFVTLASLILFWGLMSVLIKRMEKERD